MENLLILGIPILKHITVFHAYQNDIIKNFTVVISRCKDGRLYTVCKNNIQPLNFRCFTFVANLLSFGLYQKLP